METAKLILPPRKFVKNLDDARLRLRPETPADLDIIYDLIRTAFETAKVKDGTEQDFAAGLREGGNYIPELALLVEYRGEIVAHIMLTETFVTQPDGALYKGVLVAPLSVKLEYRDRGVGSWLISEAMARAADMGYGTAFLCGDPGYYRRFGFRSVADFGLITLQDIPLQFVMAAELRDGALSGITGTVDFC